MEFSNTLSLSYEMAIDQLISSPQGSGTYKIKMLKPVNAYLDNNLFEHPLKGPIPNP
jgi:hypothetical protein